MKKGIFAQLDDLVNLKWQGAITQEEYQKRQRAILSQLPKQKKTTSTGWFRWKPRL